MSGALCIGVKYNVKNLVEFSKLQRLLGYKHVSPTHTYGTAAVKTFPLWWRSEHVSLHEIKKGALNVSIETATRLLERQDFRTMLKDNENIMMDAMRTLLVATEASAVDSGNTAA